MENSEHHVMIVAKRHENGTEEWACPIAGGGFCSSGPEYRRIILNPGDEQATHTGGSGGVSMARRKSTPTPPPNQSLKFPWTISTPAANHTTEPTMIPTWDPGQTS
jgi:hypothetical protein